MLLHLTPKIWAKDKFGPFHTIQNCERKEEKKRIEASGPHKLESAKYVHFSIPSFAAAVIY